ncbi:MAG TPA: isoprenylcysteine carboxylmethyltransferase family protein [Nitrospiria bacterium]|nr:isoprenylcysteine carboxylmethyltransferase family protein [Nitrospiria bacterium]
MANVWKKATKKTIPIYIISLLLVLFAKPDLKMYIAGLLLIIAGELVRVWAAGHLRKNMEVTTTGPYAYVKNPLYLGTLFIMTGFSIMARNIYVLAIGLMIFFFYYVPFKKGVESDRLRERFGDLWTRYDKHVPDYIPRISPYPEGGGKSWDLSIFIDNSEHGIVLIVLLGMAAIGVRLLFN